jgi:F0F1-type ATP synthase assembly protein I
MAPAGAACGAAGKLESCVVEHPERRSTRAWALEMAARSTTIGVEFAVPPAAGYVLDTRLGTLPLATVCGLLLGFLGGMLHLVHMAREMEKGMQGPKPPGRADTRD